MKPLPLLLTLAFLFWTAMFFPPMAGALPFWPTMVFASGLLAAGALVTDRKHLAPQFRFQWIDLPLGLLSAGVLYAVFYLGNALSALLLPFAPAQIDSIYAIRSAMPHWLIALLLVLWIGPAEEIFWRGFIQRRLMEKCHPLVGFLLAAALYAAVHLPSLNPMLIAAAGICGLFWGLLYALTNRLWPVILSHALWDVLIFILFPI